MSVFGTGYMGQIKLVAVRFLRQTVRYMKLKQSSPLPILVKGQLWKTRTARVEIMNIGKVLAQYRYFDGGRRRVPTTMAPVREILKHLKANDGKLIKNDRLKVAA